MPDFRRTAKTLNFSHLPDEVTTTPNNLSVATNGGYFGCPSNARV
jgi:hypothetical protein